jgi:hypothetical protein
VIEGLFFAIVVLLVVVVAEHAEMADRRERWW